MPRIRVVLVLLALGVLGAQLVTQAAIAAAQFTVGLDRHAALLARTGRAE